MTWSAQQYLNFEQERTRPVRDLVAAIPKRDVRIAVDLGCGPGNSTEVLAQRFPTASITGTDNSNDMLIAARQRLPHMHFELSDIATWRPTQLVDVILANASLQWLPNHTQLYPRLINQLAPGGCLAIQTPDNLEEPAHTLVRELAANGPWAKKTAKVQLPARHQARDYYELLQPHCSTLDVWRTTYFHPLAGGAAAVIEWFKGSALRPYLELLEESEKTEFLQRYLAAVTLAYPALADGTVLLPFPRLFIVATSRS
ncbi:trans-aconitate 2-methyltransferase [Alcaligenaceae bacterium]|nr:trans-aconitate 2-methyltransferase [Alcaligenaceae bacterium]